MKWNAPIAFPQASQQHSDHSHEAPGMKRPPHDSRKGLDRIDLRWRPWRP